jgi:hypothetical protein
MARKSNMQNEVEKSEQAMPIIGRQIKTKAVINQLTVGQHQDKISLTSFSLKGKDNEVITDMVKNERVVLLTIDLEKPDASFPPIQVEGQLKGYKISKTCDAPDIINIQFSSDQVHQLTNFIRAEQEIVLKFVEKEPELEFGDGEETKSDAEAA